MTNLLPPNATAQEQAITEVIDYPLDPAILRGIKFNPSDDLVPWLIWEYGLNEILPWLNDPQRLLQEGIQFQRLRGTPAALQIGLGWIYPDAVHIEEEPPGQHFAEFQVGFEDVPPNFFVDAVVGLAQYAAPARSRLTRLFNTRYDVRRFRLDDSLWGNLLSDHSGVRLSPGGPVLSFGRAQASHALVSPLQLASSILRLLSQQSRSEDIYRLDGAMLGDTAPHVLNHPGMYLREHGQQNGDPLAPLLPNVYPSQNLTKALIVLSDSWGLGDVNACFAASTSEEVGQIFSLNQDQLSHHGWALRSTAILERFNQNHSAAARCETDTQKAQGLIHKDIHSVCDTQFYRPNQPYRMSDMYCTTAYQGANTWHQHRHLSCCWSLQGVIGNIRG